MDTIRWFKARAKAFLKATSSDPKAQGRFAAVWREAEPPSLQRAQHVVAVEAELERSVAVVMAEEPLLNDFGIGLYDGHRRKPREERQRIFAKDRRDLRSNLDDVEWTVDWLAANIAPIKTINRRRSSYGLKHIAEKQSPRGYITNGAFIAAAMIAGYAYTIPLGSANVHFGMSERSIKAAARQAR